MFKRFLNSFRMKKEFIHTFLIDSAAFTMIALLFLGIGRLLSYQADKISQGKTTEEIKMALLSGTAEANKAFLADVRILAYLLVFGIIIALIAALLIYSFSRMLLWSKLLKKRSKWGKWNLFAVLTLVIFIIYSATYYLLKFVINSLAVIPEWAINIFAFILMLLFLFFIILANCSFAEKGKVWEAVGNSFHLFRRLWKIFPLAFIVGIILSLLLYLLQNLPLRLSLWNGMIFSFAFFLLFLSWLRLYLLQEMRHEHQ